MTYPENSAYGDKLYGRLMEKWHAMDHCQSSPILVRQLLEEVEQWLVSKYMERNLYHDDDQYLYGYNEAIDDMIKDLK